VTTNSNYIHTQLCTQCASAIFLTLYWQKDYYFTNITYFIHSACTVLISAPPEGWANTHGELPPAILFWMIFGIPKYLG